MLQLAEFIRRDAKFSTLRFSGNGVFEFQQFSGALVEAIVKRDSPLRCLELAIDSELYTDITTRVLRRLMTAVANSTRLEHFWNGTAPEL